MHKHSLPLETSQSSVNALSWDSTGKEASIHPSGGLSVQYQVFELPLPFKTFYFYSWLSLTMQARVIENVTHYSIML